MVIRKNISLDEKYIHQLDKLLQINGGNLSAAIRDSISISNIAIQHYGSVDSAITGISSNKKEISSREQSIKTGENVLLSSPVFAWMLKVTKGMMIDQEILNELLDPLKIKSTSELNALVNAIINQSGWNCNVLIYCNDIINPETATVEIRGENEQYRDFVAQLVVMFLVNNKNLDIDIVHRRATYTRIDLKSRGEETEPESARKYFGAMTDILKECLSNEGFCKNLIQIYNSVNYNMVSIYKDLYEDLLAGNMAPDTGMFESISKKHIKSIPHSEFLHLLKNTHESLRIIEKIEVYDHVFTVNHNYKKEKAIQKLMEYYISLLHENGHEYEGVYSTSLIKLKHVCCMD
ncbi:MAG: hypothetical protein SCH70_03915 [Candidatus Methanoperedens sp.]|nr:hypothetical protein [Candidatus Methanoperedens sp.]